MAENYIKNHLENNEDTLTRIRNAQSLNRGKSFEELISIQCKAYRKRKEALILKTPEPFQVFRRTKTGFFEGRFTKSKAQPDFSGTLSTGQSFMMEAKATSKDRILQGVLTDTQASLLDEFSSYGCVCGVIVEIQQRHFYLPYSVWKNMKEKFGHKYITCNDAADYEITQGLSGPIPFLDIVNKEGISSENKS